jgi:hypothetical protein
MDTVAHRFAHAADENVILGEEILEAVAKTLGLKFKVMIAYWPPRLRVQSLSNGVVLVLVAAAIHHPSILRFHIAKPGMAPL